MILNSSKINLSPIKMKLDRRYITNKLSSSTPLVVLIEIADAHGIDYDINSNTLGLDLLEIIQEEPCNDDNNFSEIARYINKDCVWSKSKLVNAYSFLKTFYSQNLAFDSSIQIGSQTNEFPISYNNCMLYFFCNKHGITTNHQTTTENMKNSLNMMNENPEYIRKKLMMLISTADKNELVNLISHQLKNIPKTYDIAPAYNKLTCIKTLQQLYVPTTNQEAIVCAALNYHIDLTKFLDPMEEYACMNDIKKYIPRDKKLSFFYKKNPTFFNLKYIYNPIFDNSFYRNINVDFNQLYSNSIMNNFHFGPIPGFIKSYEGESDIFMEELKDCSFGEIFVFGVIDQMSTYNNGNVILIDELIEHFKANKCFVSPFKNDEIMSEEVIDHLIKLITETEILKIKEKQRELIQIINDIREYQNSLDRKTLKFRNKYYTSNKQDREKYIKILNQILYCGLYVRGWKGPGHDYSHAINSGTHDTSFEPIRDENYANSLIELQDMINCQIGNYIMDLPLVKLVDGKYQLPSTNKGGLTIRERLSIMMKGNMTENIHSCVRLSSNYLCSSAHKYLCALEQAPPFDKGLIKEIG